MDDRADDTFDDIYEGGLVYLPECLTDKTRIRNVLFKNCDLIGPAIVIIDDCLFAGGWNLRMPEEVKVESMIWPAHEPQLIGVIGITNCKFYKCTWEGIGFASADEEDVALMLEKATIARFELDLKDD